MSLSAGSVSVASNDVATGSGLALAMYQADVATRPLPTVPTLGSTAAPWTTARPVSQADVDGVKAARLATLQEASRLATAWAGAIVAHITANGHAVVSGVSVGRTPDPNDPDTPIAAPASPVELPIQ
jgi:hypothetical protein